MISIITTGAHADHPIEKGRLAMNRSYNIEQTQTPPLFSKRELFHIILPLILQQILAITIGTAEQMETFVEKLKEILK